MASSSKYDLIDHFKLESEVYEDYVVHTSRSRGNKQTRTRWERRQPLGSGSFGEVWLEQNSTGSYTDFFMNFSGWYENDRFVFIATEFFEHGDLEAFLGPGLCGERDASQIMFQVLEGLKILHDEGFAHRNLKPQNIYVAERGPNWCIKIGGFGISKQVNIEDQTALRTQVGTPLYMAPEANGLIDKDDDDYEYTTAVDIWAVGCIAYRLLTAKPPFPSLPQAIQFIRGRSGFPWGPLQAIGPSTECISFIQSTIAPEPAERLTAEAALQHAWFVGVQAPSSHDESSDPREIENELQSGSNLSESPMASNENAATANVPDSSSTLGLGSSLDMLTSFMNSVGRFKIEVDFQQGFTVETKPQNEDTVTWFRQEELGRGLSGEVWLERQINGRKTRAVKRLQKNAIPELDYRKELFAMVKISEDHLQHFVEFYGWFENPADPNAFFIAMEYIKHGDLRKYIQSLDRAPLTERDSRLISKQLLEGLSIMHTMSFSHRDLKPQNLFVVQRFPTWWIKIGDFGIAKQNTNTSLKTKIGSPSYQAPEVSGYIDTDTDEYTNLCDVWSLGCVIYWLLTEEVPFPATKPKRLMDFVEDSNTFPAHILHEKRVSDSGIDFVKRMIVARPEERPSTNVVLEHPWVKEVESIPRHSSDQHPPLPVRQK